MCVVRVPLCSPPALCHLTFSQFLSHLGRAPTHTLTPLPLPTAKPTHSPHTLASPPALLFHLRLGHTPPSPVVPLPDRAGPAPLPPPPPPISNTPFPPPPPRHGTLSVHHAFPCVLDHTQCQPPPLTRASYATRGRNRSTAGNHLDDSSPRYGTSANGLLRSRPSGKETTGNPASNAPASPSAASSPTRHAPSSDIHKRSQTSSSPHHNLPRPHLLLSTQTHKEDKRRKHQQYPDRSDGSRSRPVRKYPST